MKKASIYLVALFTVLCSCSNKQVESSPTHMSFMGLSLDGTRQNFLSGLQVGVHSDSIFGNLELRVDSISTKSFICSSLGMGAEESNIWFEFFFYNEPFNNKIVGLQGFSIMTPQIYDVLRISLMERLGYPAYDKRSLTPELMYELDVHEALVYNDLESDDFEIWKTEAGYVILQHSNSSVREGAYSVEMNIIDKINFDEYVDAQLAQANN